MVVVRAAFQPTTLLQIRGAGGRTLDAHGLRCEQEAEQAKQRAEVRAALEGGLAEPRNQRQWQDSAQGEAVAMVESFARCQTHAPHGSALHALLDLGFPVTPDGAALMLKRIGYWPRNYPNSVVRQALPTICCVPRWVVARLQWPHSRARSEQCRQT